MTKAIIFWLIAIAVAVLALVHEALRAGYESGYDRGLEDALKMIEDSIFRGWHEDEDRTG